MSLDNLKDSTSAKTSPASSPVSTSISKDFPIMSSKIPGQQIPLLNSSNSILASVKEKQNSEKMSKLDKLEVDEKNSSDGDESSPAPSPTNSTTVTATSTTVSSAPSSPVNTNASSEAAAGTSASSTSATSNTPVNNSGRWNDAEHQLFLTGFKLYGGEWDKVQKLVKSRTLAQIRSHAQKYFAKLQRKEQQESFKLVQQQELYRRQKLLSDNISSIMQSQANQFPNSGINNLSVAAASGASSTPSVSNNPSVSLLLNNLNVGAGASNATNAANNLMLNNTNNSNLISNLTRLQNTSAASGSGNVSSNPLTNSLVNSLTSLNLPSNSQSLQNQTSSTSSTSTTSNPIFNQLLNGGDAFILQYCQAQIAFNNSRLGTILNSLGIPFNQLGQLNMNSNILLLLLHNNILTTENLTELEYYAQVQENYQTYLNAVNTLSASGAFNPANLSSLQQQSTNQNNLLWTLNNNKNAALQNQLRMLSSNNNLAGGTSTSTTSTNNNQTDTSSPVKTEETPNDLIRLLNASNAISAAEQSANSPSTTSNQNTSNPAAASLLQLSKGTDLQAALAQQQLAILLAQQQQQQQQNALYNNLSKLKPNTGLASLAAAANSASLSEASDPTSPSTSAANISRANGSQLHLLNSISNLSNLNKNMLIGSMTGIDKDDFKIKSEDPNAASALSLLASESNFGLSPKEGNKRSHPFPNSHSPSKKKN